MPGLTSGDVNSGAVPKQGVCDVCDGLGEEEVYVMKTRSYETRACPACEGKGVDPELLTNPEADPFDLVPDEPPGRETTDATAAHGDALIDSDPPDAE